MAKLTDIKITACPSKPNLFPHIHFGDEHCNNPRYNKSDGYDTLMVSSESQFTINEVGPHNHDGLDPFESLAQLFAAAPKLLAALAKQLGDDDARMSREVRDLVNALMQRTIPDADETGYGPYFNEDGTTWQPKP